MRRRRSTRKIHVYKRKSRKSKKTKRHVKRHNKQSIKRYNYRGGNKVDLTVGKQIDIDDNLRSKRIFDLGDFTKRKRLLPIRFYIKFPKMTVTKDLLDNIIVNTIPYYQTHDNRHYDIELYWSSRFNPNYLDRKISGLQFNVPNYGSVVSSITSNSNDYDDLNINKSIIKKILQFLEKYTFKLRSYSHEEYNKLE